MKNISVRQSKENEILSGIDIFCQAMGREKESEGAQRLKKFALTLVRYNFSQNYVVEHEKKLIGNGTLIFQEPTAWITSFGILPEFQRMGIGKELLKKLIGRAKSLGFDSIHLYATKEGESLYHEFGFQAEYPAQRYIISEAPKLEIISEIDVSNTFPDWIWEHDKNSMGYDRKNYLKSQLDDTSRVICCKNNGYGLLSGDIIGPVISDNVNMAIDIILKSIELGAKNIIIPKHNKLNPQLFSRLKLKEIEGTRNLKMTLGKPISINLKNIYALRNFGAG